MKVLFAAVAAIAMLGAVAPSYAQKTYDSEAQAERDCRHSPVVWLNFRTHVYRMEGEKNFGMMRDGAFACQAAADEAGYRAAMARSAYDPMKVTLVGPGGTIVGMIGPLSSPVEASYARQDMRAYLTRYHLDIDVEPQEETRRRR